MGGFKCPSLYLQGGYMKKYLLTIVSMGTEDDSDVIEFKRKEKKRQKQAAQRAARANAIKEAAVGDLKLKVNTSHPKFKTTLACKLIKS
jgi:hypothetical protein